MLSTLVRIGGAGVDGLGALLEALGLRWPSLEPDRLLAKARGRTGLSDFGEWEYPDALAVAAGSLASDASLSWSGRVALSEHLTLALQTRLQLVHLRKTRPELFERPLNRPLIVVGLPRSGTTFLHRLLVDLPGHRGLRTWEIRRPFPPVGGADRRRTEAAIALWLLRARAPELDAKHVLDVDAAEECVGLFDASLWTPSLWRLAACRSYLSWYLAQDPAPGYAVYRQLLQVFQDRHPDARLTLKLPNHLGFVGPLLAAIPEALVVQTHRDPVPVIASYNSLMHSVHGVGSPHVRRAVTGRDALEMWGTLADRCVAQRAALPEGRVLDVDYRALIADPVGQVRAIHTHFGLPFDDALAERVQRMVDARPQNKHGKHVYALEDAALDADEVAARFGSYAATWLDSQGRSARPPQAE